MQSTTTLLLLLVILFIQGCQRQQQPRTLALPETIPVFTDDGNRQELLKCAQTHLEYLLELPDDHRLQLGATNYPVSWLRESMDDFISLLRSTPEGMEIHKSLLEQFDILQAGGRNDHEWGSMLVTGYFEPIFQGSYTANEHYRYPLYQKPASLIILNDQLNNTQRIGRLDHNVEFTSYWTRAQIETQNLLAGNELVYLSDPLDAFLIHVQGSAKILLPDNTTVSVQYAANNGHQYNSIGKLLVDEGKMTREESSIPAIRSYLDRHPDELQRILHHNPRYIFFKLADNSPPRGNLGTTLTAGRSIAIDQSVLPKELFGWLATRRPVVDRDGTVLDWIKTTRFVIPQDSGKAIEGAGRVDLFWGNSVYGAAAAGHMKESGQLYFFIKKGYEPIRGELVQ